jgi:hypothetical protein
MSYTSYQKGYNEILNGEKIPLELSLDHQDYQDYVAGRKAAMEFLGLYTQKQEQPTISQIDHSFYVKTIETDTDNNPFSDIIL